MLLNVPILTVFRRLARLLVTSRDDIRCPRLA